MRLDIYLNKNFDIQSRNKADELIKANKIKVNGKIVSKSSFKVDENSKIEILEDDFYVSRSAYKLKHFLDEININLENKTALDIGSSTGGFTQILLEHKVKHVTCVDVGSNQLHDKVKMNKNISFFENTDIRSFQSESAFEVVACDVSFISILHIIEDINRLANKDIIILYKPQYEVGSNVKRNTKGVLKDLKAVELVRKTFLDTCTSLNWKLLYNNFSKVSGKEGNQEELFYFTKT
ncbi:MAG: TlyA family RNA methyltransferase [Campylobacteraceae bacterium]|nr:TlyA family RNA methyltransferase [Campylobacteraceae bacterium]